MILVDGALWGTAREIAEQLGHGVTPAAVRRWADREGLVSVRMTDDVGRPQVRYPLIDAIRIEARKRHGPAGRRRSG